MSLVKSKRPQAEFDRTGDPGTLSYKMQKLEAESNAVELRRIITRYLLVDFCVNDSTIKYIIGKSKFRKLKTEEPDTPVPELTESELWFIREERKAILDILRAMHMHIVAANSIFAEHDVEFYERRRQQDLAVGNCYQLLKELQYIIDILPDVNINKYLDTTRLINREIALIKGWRGSDRTRYNEVRAERGEPPLGPPNNNKRGDKPKKSRSVKPDGRK